MELRRQIESASLKIQNLKVEIEKVMDEMKKREEESKMMMG